MKRRDVLVPHDDLGRGSIGPISSTTAAVAAAAPSGSVCVWTGQGHPAATDVRTACTDSCRIEAAIFYGGTKVIKTKSYGFIKMGEYLLILFFGSIVGSDYIKLIELLYIIYDYGPP